MAQNLLEIVLIQNSSITGTIKDKVNQSDVSNH